MLLFSSTFASILSIVHHTGYVSWFFSSYYVASCFLFITLARQTDFSPYALVILIFCIVLTRHIDFSIIRVGMADSFDIRLASLVKKIILPSYELIWWTKISMLARLMEKTSNILASTINTWSVCSLVWWNNHFVPSNYLSIPIFSSYQLAYLWIASYLLGLLIVSLD